jgi:hypothetical protein
MTTRGRDRQSVDDRESVPRGPGAGPVPSAFALRPHSANRAKKSNSNCIGKDR